MTSCQRQALHERDREDGAHGVRPIRGDDICVDEVVPATTSGQPRLGVEQWSAASADSRTRADRRPVSSVPDTMMGSWNSGLRYSPPF
ncbi:hypothetical protein PG994_009714 [Apiospora phragmitis]|uniref:Uncharacterized protein n=1 Tax=Apiospora phragmitis TaxID=2905665 RepID=A0ABR1U700_9PEZI